MLPLIEAFMVVSKPYIAMHKGKVSISRSPSDIQIVPNEEMFLTFTEEHKKLMNNMVRNCPSLMSGSFALLVHNPKG
jgi:E3 ubiquitin-protein ligase HUWE1